MDVEIWTLSSLYWTLGSILALLGGLVVMGALALVIQIGRHRRQAKITEGCRRRVERLLNRVQRQGMEAITDGDAPRRRSHRRLMGQALMERLEAASGGEWERTSRLYTRLGYVDRDRRLASSRQWTRRLEAMRRLYSLVGFWDRALLIKGLEDHPRIRLLSAHLLVRRGEMDDAVDALNALELTSSLMESPVYAMLQGVEDVRLKRLLTELDRIRDSRVRRALVVSAAERDVDGLEDTLRKLRASEDVDIRVGVCLAAAQRGDEFAAGLLEELLADPSWEVRAYAAKSLSTRSSQERLNTLAWALNDPAFWSRDGAEPSSDPAAIEGEATPTDDELCYFHEYLDNAVRWIPHFTGEQTPVIRQKSTTVGRGAQ